MKSGINTPFGNIEVKLNNEIIDFQSTTKLYYFNRLKSRENIKIYFIDIDTKDMSLGDVIFCGFEKQALKYYGGEERSEILIVENEEFILGFCGYEPQYHESEKKLHSFIMEDYNENGFTYIIEQDPYQFQDTAYQTRVITLAICCVERNRFGSLEEAKNIIMKALSDEIKYDLSLFKGTIKDAQNLIKQYLGKGEVVGNHKERIRCSKIIGTYISIDGKRMDTDCAIIHYTNKGSWLIPTSPNEEEKKLHYDFFKFQNYQYKKGKLKQNFLLIGLFFLLMGLYIFFAKSKGLFTEINYLKLGIGVFGVIILFYSLVHLFKDRKKCKHTKKHFLMMLFILSVTCLILGIIIYQILCKSEFVRNEFGVAIGLTIIFLTCICEFVFEYEIEKKETIVTNKIINHESLGFNNLKNENTINKQFDCFVTAFPNHLKRDLLTLSELLFVQKREEEKKGFQNQIKAYTVNKEVVQIPYRIYMNEVEDLYIEQLTNIQQKMLYCMYSRSDNGHVREKYIRKILDDEIQEWQIPFLVTVCSEYVMEILEVVYDKLKDRNNDSIKEFCRNNQEILCKDYLNMMNYWNEFYQKEEVHFRRYVGRKLYRECFGYNRSFEKKQYQCQCCGYYTIKGTFHDYIQLHCPVCYWQNNIDQNAHPKLEIGYNKINLESAKKNYKKMSAITEDAISYVRSPLEQEKKKIDVNRILKLVKLKLSVCGFCRKKNDGNPFYEYQNRYFRISYMKTSDALVVEYATNIENAKKGIWENGKSFSIFLEKENLVTEIIDYMIKKCRSVRKKQNKRKKINKRKVYNVVKSEINKWDPLGLLKKGAPSDEYHLEITRISNKIKHLETAEKLGKYIQAMFQELFGENIFIEDIKTCQNVAQSILMKLKG